MEGQYPTEGKVTSSKYPSIKFYRLSFIDINVTVKDTRLYIQRGTFRGKTSLHVARNDPNFKSDKVYMKFRMYESKWLCHAECNSNEKESDGNCQPSCLLQVDTYLTYTEVAFYLADNIFIDTAVRVKLMSFGEATGVTVRNNSFASGSIPTPGGAEIDVLVGDIEDVVHINITNSSFVNISTVIPNYECTMVRALSVNVRPLESFERYKREHINITNLFFEGNHRALSVSGYPIESLAMEDLVFKNNYALLDDGAALYLNVTAKQIGTDVSIYNCVFENNMAGFVPDEKLQNARISSYEPGIIKITGGGTKIYEQNLLGKGGAIALYNGASVTMKHCAFVNNSAYNFGGSLYQASGISWITLMNVSFEASGERIAERGDVIYARGSLFISSATFVVHKASGDVSIVQQSRAEAASLTIFNISLICPVGYSLHVDKTTALNPQLYQDKGYVYGDEKDFVYLDRIYLWCQPCKGGLYSIEQGYLKIVTSDEVGIEVLEFEHTGITCRRCPYGGLCEGEIRSVPSYWGYVTNNEIIFEHCLQGQCCYTEPCPGYDHCAQNRYGTLCSQCIPGYSRATFSQMCVHSSDCGLWWFWPVTIGLGFAYALFLLFEDDITEMAINLLKKFSGEETVNEAKIVKLSESKTLEGLTRVHTIAEKFHSNILLGEKHPVNDKLRNEITNFKKPEQTTTESNSNDDPDYLQIMVNFIQDAALFYVYMPTNNATNESLILKVFGFTLSVINIIDNACFRTNLNAVQLLFMKSIVGPTLITVYGIAYFVLFLLNFGYDFKNSPGKRGSKVYFYIKERLTSAFVLTLLFSFQSLLITSLTLLDCVELTGDTLLKIDTNIKCYQKWQYVVLGYVVTCSVPFPILLLILPSLLKHKIMSQGHIFIAGIFPLPFLIIWLFKTVRFNVRKFLQGRNKISPGKKLTKIRVIDDTECRKRNLRCIAGFLPRHTY